MGDELSWLLEIFTKMKEAGGQATLTATTSEGKTKLKLEIVSSPSETAPPPLQPAPGQARRRHRGAAARARRRKRAADHQGTTLAAPAPVSPPPATPAPGEASAPHQQYHPPLRHPPHLLLSPSPSSGRRRVMSVGRPSRWPTPLGSLNLDGPPPSPPSFPPPPPPPPSPPPSSRPLARTALRVRTVNLRDFGGSDEGLANLAEQFHENNYRRRWVSLSRSVDSDCSSSCSSASPLSPSGSVSDHSDCSDLGSEGCWETDSDVG